jgi:hypothetical protein
MRRLLLVALISLLAAVVAAQKQKAQFEVIDRDIVEERVYQYDGDDTKREATLKQMFQEAGCLQLSEQPVKRVPQPNLICIVPGETAQQIVVGAHFDHVDAGHGVIDNWSGASLLPTLFQSISQSPRRHTFVFIGFAGEERGMLGSETYVKQLSPQQRAGIQAMINLDSLGLGPTEVWESHADSNLVGALKRVAQSMKLPVHNMNVEQVATSDSEPFGKAKIPRMTVHSATPETYYILHSRQDHPKALRMNDYYDTYRLLAGYLAYLDTSLPTPQAAPAPANAKQP